MESDGHTVTDPDFGSEKKQFGKIPTKCHPATNQKFICIVLKDNDFCYITSTTLQTKKLHLNLLEKITKVWCISWDNTE